MRLRPRLLVLFVGLGAAVMATPLIVDAQSMMGTTQPVPLELSSVIDSGDFNNDGILDIITPNFIFLGRPDGTFGPPIPTNPERLGADLDCADFAVGDFDHDGNLDIVIFDQFSPGLRVLFGKGDGTFRVGDRMLLHGGTASPTSIAAADFNNDGKLDLAVATDVPEVEILEGDGRGNFSLANTLQLGPSLISCFTQVRAGDFNNDGNVDLAVLQPTTPSPNTLSAWFGNGNFAFDEVVLNHYASAVHLTTVDINQDGFTDIMVSFDVSPPGASRSPHIFELPFNSGVDGYFGQGSRSLKLQNLIIPSDTVGEAVGAVLAADIDGDGTNDIVSLGFDLSGRSSVFVWKGNPDGTFQQTPAVQFTISGEHGGVGLAAGDFNRDGKIDFLATDVTTNFLHVFLNATPRAPCVKSATNQSVTICQPQEATFSNSPLRVVAETTSTNPVTGINLYVDNVLRSQFRSSAIDQLVSLPDGNHFVEVKGLASNGSAFRSSRHVTIFSGVAGMVCPTSTQGPSIHICLPADNATETSPVQVFANSYSADIITAIQVYIDNKLEFNDATETTWLNRPFPLGPGMHFIVVKAFDANGRQLTDSRMINVTE